MSKFKKIAVKLWSISEEDRSWLLHQLNENEVSEIRSHLSALSAISDKADTKLTDLVIDRYLSYSKQELDLLTKISSPSFQPEFKELIEYCLDGKADYVPSFKVKQQLFQMEQHDYGQDNDR
ncbi:hypothetical protein [Kangiella sp. HZ709]|uniref:hypothetical protein n=1 Tax=Kangiella sp. HZ709 TaxID=2666328 RepID=UPI0018A22AA0|nr:hypothetical protein [Kangiella sp. HZ709]